VGQTIVFCGLSAGEAGFRKRERLRLRLRLRHHSFLI